MEQAPTQAESVAELHLRGENNLVGVSKYKDTSWIEVWRDDQGWVQWAIATEAAGRCFMPNLRQFVNWAKRMGLAEAKEQTTLGEGIAPRPICEAHNIALSGPYTVKKGLPQNVGRQYYACSLNCKACSKPSFEAPCEGGDNCCGLKGWLWADGSLPYSAVSHKGKQEFDAKRAQETAQQEKAQPETAQQDPSTTTGTGVKRRRIDFDAAAVQAAVPAPQPVAAEAEPTAEPGHMDLHAAFAYPDYAKAEAVLMRVSMGAYAEYGKEHHVALRRVFEAKGDAAAARAAGELIGGKGGLTAMRGCYYAYDILLRSMSGCHYAHAEGPRSARSTLNSAWDGVHGWVS